MSLIDAPTFNTLMNDVDGVTNTINNYFAKAESIRDNKEYKVEVLVEQSKQLGTKTVQDLANKLNEFQATYRYLDGYLKVREKSETGGYAFADKTDELLYYQKKADYMRHLEAMSGVEMLELYDNADKFQQKVIEQEGPFVLKQKKDAKSITLENRIKARRESMLSEETIAEKKRLDKYRQLYDFSERFSSELKNNNLSNNNVYTWLGLYSGATGKSVADPAYISDIMASQKSLKARL